MNADVLREEIAAAFTPRPRPPEAFLRREGCAGYEGEEARQWLGGKTWQQLRAEGMTVEQRDLVHFLTPEGWLYYFPALASFALDPGHPAEMDDTLLVKLAWYPREVAPLMTPAERRAVVRFLEHLAESEEPERQELPRYALDFYWTAQSEDPPPPGSGAASVTAREENGDAVS